MVCIVCGERCLNPRIFKIVPYPGAHLRLTAACGSRTHCTGDRFIIRRTQQPVPQPVDVDKKTADDVTSGRAEYIEIAMSAWNDMMDRYDHKQECSYCARWSGKIPAAQLLEGCRWHHQQEEKRQQRIKAQREGK